MSEGRKKQKQNPSYKGKGSEIVLVGRQPTSPPALWRVTAERRTRVCFCPLTPAVVVIHGMTDRKPCPSNSPNPVRSETTGRAKTWAAIAESSKSKICPRIRLGYLNAEKHNTRVSKMRLRQGMNSFAPISPVKFKLCPLRPKPSNEFLSKSLP